MSAHLERLDGWKAIAAFFGRERTTVIRWARDRGMPVHALPGGKTRTVYALRSELEAWSRSIGDATAPVATADESTIKSGRAARGLRARALAATVLVALAIFLFFVLAMRPKPRPPHTAIARTALPADPDAAALFLQARDDWAQRNAKSLTRSIGEFQRVTRLAPDFAPAFADLADAYILAGEVGSLPRDVAFDGAQHAADRAMRLDPGLAGGQRAKGFILYWWMHDRKDGGAALRAAMRLDPDAAQTHFWYANILADNGEDTAATREFDKARLADPGSDQISADYAWSLWMAGRTDDAIARLTAIVAQQPDIAEAHDCLATIRLAQGDWAGFLRELGLLARLRREPALAATTQAFGAAFLRGGSAALLTAALDREMADQADAPYPDHSLAAFYASLAGDRPALIRVLATADAQHEQWGSAGYIRRIRQKWRGDTIVLASLDRRAAPKIDR